MVHVQRAAFLCLLSLLKRSYILIAALIEELVELYKPIRLLRGRRHLLLPRHKLILILLIQVHLCLIVFICHTNNVDDIDTELVFPLRSETHTKNPLTTSKKKKKLLRTASSNERSDYATSTEKKPHCNTLDSPTNPPIKRFLERQRSLTGTETEIGNDADGVDEESGHTTWLVKMGKKYETVLDSLPARCIGTICNIVLTGGFFLFFIFCIAALFSLSYLYDHKDSGKQNKLIILNIIVFQ